ncbi:MAG: hypothetical protein U0414_28865 [Polyangiaceae bacterium]
MNRADRKSKSLSAQIELKQTRTLKPKAGKKLKRWKKALAAAQQPAGAAASE